jgi:hypothetical protein
MAAGAFVNLSVGVIRRGVGVTGGKVVVFKLVSPAEEIAFTLNVFVIGKGPPNRVVSLIVISVLPGATAWKRNHVAPFGGIPGLATNWSSTRRTMSAGWKLTLGEANWS